MDAAVPAGSNEEPTNRRIDQGEIRALIDAVDDEAEVFLTACVHFAKLMQVDVEQGDALAVLKGMKDELYERLNYYERCRDPITGRIRLPPITGKGQGWNVSI